MNWTPRRAVLPYNVAIWLIHCFHLLITMIVVAATVRLRFIYESRLYIVKICFTTRKKVRT